MQSGLVQPPIYNFKDPNPIFVYGDPLCTFGFENFGVVNGMGLVSFGLLWQLKDFWFDVDYYSNLSTTWAQASGSSIATTWTSPQFGMFGPYTP